jgi:chromosome segregation ATPase
MFNPLKFAAKLKRVGVPEKQADAQAEAIAEIFEDKVIARFDTIDTHLDSIDTRMDSLDDRMDSLDKRMDSLDRRIDSLDNKIERLDLKIDFKGAEIKTDIIKWFIGVSLAQSAIIVSCLKLIH